MEELELISEEITHKVDLRIENHQEEKIKKQKKILNTAIKHLRRLAMDKMSNRVGEC